MRRKLFTLVLFIIATIVSATAQTPPNNEIWYTTTDGKKANLVIQECEYVISNTYSNGKGVIRANKPFRYYGLDSYCDEVFGYAICDEHLNTISFPNSVAEFYFLHYQYGDNYALYKKNLRSFEGKYASVDGRCLGKNGSIIAFAPAGLTHYSIPYGMSEIGQEAFYGCTKLTSITIPDGVKKIDSGAFADCKSLTSITIPESVTYVGYNAFKGCTRLSNITIPDGVKAIDSWAFADCKSLTSITIPESVTYVGWRAFDGCSSLTSFRGKFASKDGRCLIIDGELVGFSAAGLTEYTIPDGVTAIQGAVFIGCNKLESIIIPNSVTKIGEDAFEGCSNLKSFGGKLASEDGRCLIIDGELVGFSAAGLTEYTIPDGVTAIQGAVFSGCNKLESIIIPNSVTKIGEDAFAGCTSLTNITIPESVTYIGPSAFSGCTNLKSISLLGRDLSLYLEFWYQNIFLGCTNLTEIVLNCNLDYYYFTELFQEQKLTDITICSDVTKISRGMFSGATGRLTLNNSNAKAEWFEGCNFSEIIIGENVTKVDPAIFNEFQGKLTIKSSLINLNNLNLSAIEELIIDCKHIKQGLLSGTNISSVTIGESVEAIDVNAFDSCVNHRKFSGKFATEDGKSLVVDGELVDVICANLTEYSIPDSVTEIGDMIFADCTSLQSITIPEGVTRIGIGAFENCSSLASITIPTSVTHIGTNVFASCRSLTSVTIPDGITSIEGYTFQNCHSLTSITIPESVTSIGYGAFYGCKSLTSINVPESVTSIGHFAFEGCSSLTDVTVANIYCYRYFKERGPNIRFGGSNSSADGRCLIIDNELSIFIADELTEYAIPEGVTKIRSGVFNGCSNLTSIVIPNSVIEIGESVFYGCSGVTSITIPEGVTQIGENALNCFNLTSLTCLAMTPPAIQLLGIPEEAKIYVPKKAIKLYKDDPNWSRYAKQIKRIK